jgi:hypothetical protein
MTDMNEYPRDDEERSRGELNETSYEFTAGDLQDSDEDVRRFAIIHISKYKLTEHEEKLLNVLMTDPSVSNRRHVVRALGKIGSHRSVEAIMKVITSESGLIVGVRQKR